MVKYSVVLLSFLFCVSSMAQEKMVFPQWRIGVTPSSLINIFPGIQFSLDKSLNERINLTAEYAFILPSLENKSGYRFHPGVELLLASGKWISYIGGVHGTYIRTVGQQKIPSRSRNREFNYLTYQDVQNSFGAISLSNSLLLKMGNRIYISAGFGVGSGRKISFADGKEVPGFRTTGNSPLITRSALYYLELNFSYSLAL